MDDGQSFFSPLSGEKKFQLARASAEKGGMRMGLFVSCYAFAKELAVKRTRAWLRNCWNERWIWELILPFHHLVENRELESEQRTISLMSFVFWHACLCLG